MSRRVRHRRRRCGVCHGAHRAPPAVPPACACVYVCCGTCCRCGRPQHPLQQLCSTAPRSPPFVACAILFVMTRLLRACAGATGWRCRCVRCERGSLLLRFLLLCAVRGCADPKARALLSYSPCSFFSFRVCACVRVLVRGSHPPTPRLCCALQRRRVRPARVRVRAPPLCWVPVSAAVVPRPHHPRTRVPPAICALLLLRATRCACGVCGVGAGPAPVTLPSTRRCAAVTARAAPSALR